MNGRLRDKIAVITGGGSGIGAAACAKFAAEGAAVIVADINFEAATAVAKDIGDAAEPIEFDALDEASIKTMVEATIDRHGRLDILFNNAALTAPAIINRDTTATEIDIEVWDKTMAANVRGYLLGARFAIPHMIAAGGGSIINTSSNAALHGDVARIAYGSSKGAVNSMTRYIAAQYGRDSIRCNAICPGLIVTPAVEQAVPEAIKQLAKHVLMPRNGVPEDIANLACFLASDEASFLTGQIISVDGGYESANASFGDSMLNKE